MAEFPDAGRRAGQDQPQVAPVSFTQDGRVSWLIVHGVARVAMVMVVVAAVTAAAVAAVAASAAYALEQGDEKEGEKREKSIYLTSLWLFCAFARRSRDLDIT